MGGMVGALIAIFGLIAFVWGLSWFQHKDPPNPAATIQYGAALSAAREQSPFHILAPEPVPPGLRATSVSWDAVGPDKTWQLGFLTPDQDFIGLFQGSGPSDAFIAAETPATKPGAPVTIRGVQWLTLTNPDRGETALVRAERGVTVVVTGTADESELVTFVTSLH
jgi:hypothetical protein